MENNDESSYEKLGCGMILLKRYISLSDQVEIVNICQQLGFHVNGFKECIPSGEKLGLQMMMLGSTWYPPSCYPDSIKPLTVPRKIISLVSSSIQDSQRHLNLKDKISSKCSNHCVVKFYTNTDGLALHEERDDKSWYRFRRKGRPVVSMFIGDSAEFFYSDARNLSKVDNILLESGDVLIFDNNSGDIFHGLHKIIPNSAPLPFLRKSMLKPGLLNLSFRRF
ncbi:alkylated DNA repair protein AlkB [Artemisia annua]|uniref:Alkylated DNA repair protein AlkB n=1 Tax=Artemisia annua TaxID=35608 RepID=A0A2U1Q356_ARTAN|nr:alkylated DNA repair protein AlkB [Artemisia annua]